MQIVSVDLFEVVLTLHLDVRPMTQPQQGGTPYTDDFNAVATDINGTSLIIGGYTYGSWVETNEAEEYSADFAVMYIDENGTLLWTYQVLLVCNRGW